jgi:hypothetical protein
MLNYFLEKIIKNKLSRKESSMKIIFTIVHQSLLFPLP